MPMKFQIKKLYPAAAIVLIVAFILFAVFFIDLRVEHEMELQGSENPAFIAVIHGRSADELSQILNDNPDYVTYVYSDQSLMDVAIREGRIDLIEILIDQGFPANGLPGRVHPLRAAMHYDQEDVAKYLLEKGSSPYMGNPVTYDLAKRRNNMKFIELFEGRKETMKAGSSGGR